MTEPLFGVADELRRRLFALLADYKALELRLLVTPSAGFATEDVALEARAQVNSAGCALARVYEEVAALPLFTDAANDRPEFAVALDLAPDFGARLKVLREKAELSVAELATKAGMNRESVRLYENGERRPTWDAVQSLAAALGISTDVFRDRTS